MIARHSFATVPEVSKLRPVRGASSCSLRVAAAGDLERLLQLEAESFDSDRLSRRSYRALLKRASATVLLAEQCDTLVGALVLLFKRGNAIARLYSLAVSRHLRGRGTGRFLLRAAEKSAFERTCAVLRLEVRVDNTAARKLYESEGFVEIVRIRRYYADGTAAVRLERSLWEPFSEHR